MTDNKDLRQNAEDAVAAYMKHELFDIGGAAMYPFIQMQAREVINAVDRAIQGVKDYDR